MLFLIISFRSRNCLPLSFRGSTEGKCRNCNELVEQIRQTSDIYQKLKFETGEEIASDLHRKDYHSGSDGDDIGIVGVGETKLEPEVKLELNTIIPSILKRSSPSDKTKKVKTSKKRKSKSETALTIDKKAYVCPEGDCRQRFIYHRCLIEHSLKVHGIEIPPLSLSAAQKEEESCPFCEEKFKPNSNASILTHMRAFHCSEREKPVYIEFMNSHMRTHVCQVCGQTFDTRQGFDLHMREVHENVLSEDMKTCPTCGKSFKNLVSHLKTHETETSLCMECGKTFKNKIRLKTHILLVHKQLEVTCSVCQKVCQSKRKLSRHVKLHHLNIRSYHCDICNKSFPEKSKLTKHVMAVHDKIKPYVCEICGFKCARVDNLNLHRRKSHNELKYMSREMLKILVENGEHPFCDKEYLPLLASDVKAFNK